MMTKTSKRNSEQITSLVTGGAGFIGSHVVDELIRMNHQVVVLDDLSGGSKNNVSHEAIFVHGSITDESLVNELFETYQFNFVYHLAAYAAEGLSHFIRGYNYTNNLLGSVYLINAAVNHNIECFVFTSSIAVYGETSPPMLEKTTPSPIDPYGIAKYAIELDLKNAFSMFGLNSIVFRPHNVYGSRQNIGDKYRNVAGIFMNQLLKEEALTVFGDGNQSRAFTHINDVAPHIARCVENEEAYNEIFNIGSDEVCSVKELAANVGEVMGRTPTIEYLQQREETVHAFADHTKFREVFESEKHTKLKDGLREMYAWVNAHGSKESASFSNIEIQKNLPNSWKTQK